MADILTFELFNSKTSSVTPIFYFIKLFLSVYEIIWASLKKIPWVKKILLEIITFT